MLDLVRPPSHLRRQGFRFGWNPVNRAVAVAGVSAGVDAARNYYNSFKRPIGPTVVVPVAKRQRTRSSVKMSGVGSSRYVRGGRRVTNQNPKRVSIKLERGIQWGGMNAVYVGGVTHPLQNTFSMVVQSIFRMMMLKANIEFASFDETMLFPSVSTQTFQFVYWYRLEAVTGKTPLNVVTVTLNQPTYAAAVGAICDSLIANFGTGPVGAGPDTAAESRRLVYIGLVGTGTSPVVASQFYKADELFVTIKGESAIQVQNRTKADSTSSDSADNIFANPLRGKYYTFKNGKPVIMSPGSLTSAHDSVFPYEPVSGIITSSDTPVKFVAGAPVLDPTTFSPSVTLQLRKPPNGLFFSNCSSTKYCSSRPGEIVRGKLVDVITKSLHAWLYVFREKFLLSPTKTFVGLASSNDPFNYKLGKSQVFGFEKMCDTTVANHEKAVTVGLEHNLFMTGVASWKPKHGIVSQINITTV